MRYAIVSDIHSNLPALKAVLADAKIIGFDQVICLGDVVGYGPYPNECLAALLAYEIHMIAGNHDWGAIGKADPLIFNHDARFALNWTQDTLTPENLALLSSLPTTKPLNDAILLSHGSPRKPVWEYLVDTVSAGANFAMFDFEIALVGHTHLPLIFERKASDKVTLMTPDFNEPLPLTGRRLILNPGSVGQPRDMNPKASYAILDTGENEWIFRRVSYPVEETQKRMHELQLPLRLIARLEMGR
ncbi:MAG: metallophosphoesterase [Anaerolineales bacterium]|nr:MAG: metallophosphoesterase [Anaerolineales bacterium]